ncbi:hypothetical protein A0U93_00625 [Neoasaia chiangmaiensis]|uniref:Uncharacterized protein n=1 Tax=Neoasaia chiangmaiensis TaxID=320497 RepID=A0A1U9KLN4_9PROT|nr:hypothetical protein A0U93_00625 [Neoasaia chiangmaiensis]
MALSPWCAVTFSLRRFALFVVALCCLSTLGLITTGYPIVLFGLRVLQGLSGGFAIPLLMTTALRVDGIVDSVPPGSGAAFEPIAPENATGNFTKIVQRLPVKIVLAPNQPLARLLRLGMSVETTVDTGLADVAAHQNTAPGTVTAK